MHARRLQQVSQAAQKDLTWTFYERNSSASNPGRTDDSNAVEIPQCLRVDSETGTSASPPCLSMGAFLSLLFSLGFICIPSIDGAQLTCPSGHRPRLSQGLRSNATVLTGRLPLFTEPKLQVSKIYLRATKAVTFFFLPSIYFVGLLRYYSASPSDIPDSLLRRIPSSPSGLSAQTIQKMRSTAEQ